MEEKQAKKAAETTPKEPVKDTIKKTAAAVVVAATVTGCTLNKKELKAAMAKEYDYDTFEKQNAIYNGLFDAIKPTGDSFKDLAAFLFGQGGGKSNDPKDPAAKWMPYEPDEDGEFYHTVHDITWRLFSNTQISTVLGYEPTPANFYNMSEEIRTGIIQYHIDLGKGCSKSDIVNYVAAYATWGSGTYRFALKRFEQMYGNIDVNINCRGEYFVFSRMLESYKEVLQQRNGSNWNIYGRGWSSGIAHFHRVFKVYCKS